MLGQRLESPQLWKPVPSVGLLLRQNTGRASSYVRIEEHQATVQFLSPLWRQGNCLDVHGLVRVEAEVPQVAIGGDVLILLPHRLVEGVDLDSARISS